MTIEPRKLAGMTEREARELALSALQSPYVGLKERMKLAEALLHALKELELQGRVSEWRRQENQSLRERIDLAGKEATATYGELAARVDDLELCLRDLLHYRKEKAEAEGYARQLLGEER